MGSGGTKHMDEAMDNAGVWFCVIFTAEVVNGNGELLSFPLTLLEVGMNKNTLQNE